MKNDGGIGDGDDVAPPAYLLHTEESEPGETTAGGPANRIAATRASLLGAAREVFALQGYHNATVTEIVQRSGTSTGSLYNRFGGKENLYLELHRQYTRRLWAAVLGAMDRARHDGAGSDGVAEPIRRFLAGTRALLAQCWAERDLVALFFSSGPPGFDALSISVERRWVDANTGFLQIADRRRGWELASAITGVIVAGAKLIIRAADIDEAADIAELYVGLVGRLAVSDLSSLD